MMLGAGCAKQLTSWILHDRPDLHMFAYDIRRFTPKQRSAYDWAVERSHEAYAKNYSIVFPYDQPLAGRNFIQDPFHKVILYSYINASHNKSHYFIVMSPTDSHK
jgi:sarcosine dehydrogenase